MWLYVCVQVCVQIYFQEDMLYVPCEWNVQMFMYVSFKFDLPMDI